MSAAIAMQNISLYIPHVFPNISSSKIFDVFEEQLIGNVRNVDLIPKKDSNGKPYNAAYIHFYEWCDNTAARNFQERVLDKSKEARIVYDEPWYWIVLENNTRKFKPGDRKPTIDLNAFGHDSTKEKEPAKPTNYISPAQFKNALLDIIHSAKKPKQVNVVSAKSAMEMEFDLELKNTEKNLFIELADLTSENQQIKQELENFKNLYAEEVSKNQVLRTFIAPDVVMNNNL
jgi:hypothetical protein